MIWSDSFRRQQKQFLIPEGFLHGFLVLSESAITSCECTNLYEPNDGCHIRRDNPDIGVKWPTDRMNILIRERGRNNVSFRSLFLNEWALYY